MEIRVTPTALKCRPATVADAAAISAVFSPSLRPLTFLPMLHTVEEDRRFIEEVILRQCEVTVVEENGLIVALLARSGEEIRLLYTYPDFIGRGAGTVLIEAAKTCGEPVLELWCFAANLRARRFYEVAVFAGCGSRTEITTKKKCRMFATAGRDQRQINPEG